MDEDSNSDLKYTSPSGRNRTPRPGLQPRSPNSPPAAMASRFLHGYYICNFLLIGAFLVLRFQRLDPGELGKLDILGFTRESSIYFCVSLMLFVRTLSAPTLDAYLATSFKVCCLAIGVLLSFMDRRMLQLFAALYTAVFVLCPQPRFRYPDSISSLNHTSLEVRVTKNTHRAFAVVWAHATWDPRCTQLAPVFADLAKRLTHPRVTFAKIDVGRWPAAATMLDVSVAAGSCQLPCAFLYRRGEQVARFPPAAEGGGIDKRWRKGFTAETLWKEFEMDKVAAEAKEWEEKARKMLKSQQSKKKE